MVITGIAGHPRRTSRLVVDVDGKEAGVITAELLFELGLRVGAPISEAQRTALSQASVETALLDRALNLLAHRARSARELARRLGEGEDSRPLVESVIARLQRMGLVDDAAFARQVVRAKVVGQGASKRRARQELFRRGVSGELADEAIGRVFEDEAVDPGTLVERAARTRLKALTMLDPETRRRRLYAFLARRGYESAEIRAAMQTVLGRERGEDGEG